MLGLGSRDGFDAAFNRIANSLGEERISKLKRAMRQRSDQPLPLARIVYP
jgi:hypothetical protein